MTSSELLKMKSYYDYVESELANTANPDSNLDRLSYSIGMAEESGEILKIIDKSSTHSIAVESGDLILEIGDYFWYYTATLIMLNHHFDNYILLIKNFLGKKEFYCEPTRLVCDQLDLLGLYQSKLFLGKNIKQQDFDKVMDRCAKSYFGIIRYFHFDITDIAFINMKKLKNRYPDGRKTNYEIDSNEKK